MTERSLRWLRLLAALLLLWCGSGCLKLTMYSASVTKPSQIAVYFSTCTTRSSGDLPPKTPDRPMRLAVNARRRGQTFGMRIRVNRRRRRADR
jgi:hypothetical protein